MVRLLSFFSSIEVLWPIVKLGTIDWIFMILEGLSPPVKRAKSPGSGDCPFSYLKKSLNSRSFSSMNLFWWICSFSPRFILNFYSERCAESIDSLPSLGSVMGVNLDLWVSSFILPRAMSSLTLARYCPCIKLQGILWLLKSVRSGEMAVLSTVESATGLVSTFDGKIMSSYNLLLLLYLLRRMSFLSLLCWGF